MCVHIYILYIIQSNVFPYVLLKYPHFLSPDSLSQYATYPPPSRPVKSSLSPMFVLSPSTELMSYIPRALSPPPWSLLTLLASAVTPGYIITAADSQLGSMSKGEHVALLSWVWDISCSITFSSSIHLPAISWVHFSLKLARIPLCVCTKFSLPTLCFFHFLAIVKRTATNMAKQLPL